MNKLEQRSTTFGSKNTSVSQSNIVFWLFASLSLGLISFAIGAVVMWANIYGHSESLLPIPPLVSSSAAATSAPTDVVVSGGINGAAPGSAPGH